MEPAWNHSLDLPNKMQQGVIWGKDPKHFEGVTDIIKQIADVVPMKSTASLPVFQHPNVQWLGHQNSVSWRKLLLSSRFLLGLGHPLLGPSAIEAAASGCMFINPTYKKPVRGEYSQHPYAQKVIGEPYVCSVALENHSAVMSCVQKALKTNLSPVLPKDFTKEAYINRVKHIFR